MKYLSLPAPQAELAQRFLRETVEQAKLIVCEFGVQLSETVKPYHIECEHELKGVFGLSFYAQGYYTQFGGERLKIWYHPGSMGLLFDATLVLDVEWWQGEFMLFTYRPSPAWQSALVALLLWQQVAA